MVTKVKIFKFLVSDYGYLQKNWNYSPPRVDSVDTIEGTINNFICYKEVVSISVNNVDVAYHNNGGSNKVQLVYTIVYKEREVMNICVDCLE